MSKSKKTYIIGNWKMNPKTSIEAETIFSTLQSLYTPNPKLSVVVCPPIIFLGDLEAVNTKNNIHIGSQDVFWEKIGKKITTYTGEIALEQLKDSKVDTVIVGHSERRALGESAHVVALKVEAVTSFGMNAVLCIGETTRDASGDYFSVVKEQLVSALKNIPPAHMKRVRIAYEPVWAIGDGGEAIRTHDMHEMSIYIRKTLIDLFDTHIASRTPILYGGSVTRENAEMLMKEGQVDGFLIGRASLDPTHFIDILSLVKNI